MAHCTITSGLVRDVRFPTSLENHGSDAMHTDPDYSCAYLVLKTDHQRGLEGHGFTFTIGRGTDIVVAAVEAFLPLVCNKNTNDIYRRFGEFYHELANETQLRWLGPEKGVTHLALAAVLNALWDLWGKLEEKPVWQLVSELTPEQIVSLVDFTYITDVVTPEEALIMLQNASETAPKRLDNLRRHGYPAYITSAGWYGYTNEQIEHLLKESLADGWRKFKVKVGRNAKEDRRRLELVREIVGPDVDVMVDANQRWSVNEAIEYMCQLDGLNLVWIEEPTSPDDVIGHRRIKEAMKPLDILVATGEHCQNRVMFKQFMVDGAMDICQIDSCRLGGLNEVLAVLLMAAKLGVRVCPHAGGVGLCELVQHIIAIDYLLFATTTEGRVCEYADHLHQHFIEPPQVRGGVYYLPQRSGYTQIMDRSLSHYEYPTGSVWKQLIDQGKHKDGYVVK